MTIDDILREYKISHYAQNVRAIVDYDGAQNIHALAAALLEARMQIAERDKALGEVIAFFCIRCGEFFIGHKRRTVCRECYMKTTPTESTP